MTTFACCTWVHSSPPHTSSFILRRPSSSCGIHLLIRSSIHPSHSVFIARFRMRTFGYEEGEGCCARLTAILLLWVLLCDLISMDLPYLVPLRRETYLIDYRPMRRPLSGASACDWFILPLPYLTLPYPEPLYSSCTLSLGSWQSISLACHCH